VASSSSTFGNACMHTLHCNWVGLEAAGCSFSLIAFKLSEFSTTTLCKLLIPTIELMTYLVFCSNWSSSRLRRQPKTATMSSACTSQQPSQLLETTCLLLGPQERRLLSSCGPDCRKCLIRLSLGAKGQGLATESTPVVPEKFTSGLVTVAVAVLSNISKAPAAVHSNPSTLPLEPSNASGVAMLLSLPFAYHLLSLAVPLIAQGVLRWAEGKWPGL